MPLFGPGSTPDWEPYFAIWPVRVDAYDESEVLPGRGFNWLKVGWVERRLDVWTDVDDEDGIEHRTWRYRLPRK